MAERKKKAREEQVINYQLQAVMNQLDPHFMFNAINAIGSATMKGKQEEAYRYFTSLSHLMPKSMANAFETSKSLEEEIDFVTQYIRIEEYRYNGKLSWDLTVDPLVDRTVMVPKMLIHIFVENAIKHGVFHNKEGGRIGISV